MAKKPVRIEKRPAATKKPSSTPVKNEPVEPAQETPAKKKIDKKILKKWWFWLIAGILVVAIVLTLACTLDYTIMSSIIRLGCRPKNLTYPQGYDEIVKKTDVLYDVRYESNYANNTMDVFMPKTEGKKPLLVYVHGGYYLGGDKASAEPYCRALAAEGYVVVSLNYALAPEVKYPGQAKQFNEAMLCLVDRAKEYGIDFSNVFFGGDSAGCHLVSEMGAAYTNPVLAQKLGITPAIRGEYLRGLLLVCGFFNLKNVRQTKFPFVNLAMWAFTDARKYESYYRAWELCTVETATADYPASLFLCAQDDKFLSQSQEFEKVLTDLGVYTEHYYPTSDHAMGHEFARNFNLAEAAVALTKAKEFLASRVVIDEKAENVHVLFELSSGDEIEVELFREYAPTTVDNFLRYVDEGFYDGTTFHRVIVNSVLQGGGGIREGNSMLPKQTHDAIYGEFSANGYKKNTLSHVAGVLSMARTSVYDSATSQFFFCSTDCPAYDGQYAAFGQVVYPADIERLKALTDVEVIGDGSEGMPKEELTLLRVTRVDPQ